MIKILTAAAAAFLVTGSAFAAAQQNPPTVTVTPTLAPNQFGSPSYDAWLANTIAAQKNDQPTAGTPGLPSYYQAQNVVGAAESIVTGFPSWNGFADPGTVFGSQFAGEYGNRMLFGLKIVNTGTQFSIGQLSFNAVSSDPANALGFSFGVGDYDYSSDYVGFLKGNDNLLFTADDILITSGSNTQLVDGLIGRGSGNSFAALCDNCTIAQQQQAINDAANYFTVPTQFKGTYSLGLSQGSGTFTIIPRSAAVPEPATWAMMLVGFGVIGFATRRRPSAVRKTVRVA